MKQSIGFIGLGSMGFPMAANLVKSGYAVRVYNRTSEKAQPLVEQGAELAKTPVEAATDSDIVITMLPNDEVVKSVVLGEDGFLKVLKDNSVHLSMSTISPVCADELVKAHESVETYYLAAPVLGRPDFAESGKLNICLAGNPAAEAQVRPVLDVLGQAVYDFGDTASSANVVKLSANFSIAAAIEAMAEAFTLAEKNGIDRAQVYQLFTETLFNCTVYKGYGKSVAKHDYDAGGFKLSLGLKDVTLALQAAQVSKVPMPLARLVHDRLLAALAKGRGDLDWSALALETSEAAGMQ